MDIYNNFIYSKIFITSLELIICAWLKFYKLYKLCM